jgi:hypothetical protein
MQMFYISCAFIVMAFILGVTAKHVHKYPIVKTIHSAVSFGTWGGLIWSIGFVNTLVFLSSAAGIALVVLVCLLRFGNPELKATIMRCIADIMSMMVVKK